MDTTGRSVSGKGPGMAEFSKNIWAPWRMEYIGTIDAKNAGGCFLCQYWTEPQQDEPNLVLWRACECMVLFNRFPYTSGHLLIAPAQHVGNIEDLPGDLLNRMMQLTQDAVQVLRSLVKPQGFNIGVNLGKCAGAGLPGHIHIHVVPRWEGDTNFVPVLAGTRVMPHSLEALYGAAKEASARLGLPRECGG
jgi:ATP adenylyltransferase